MRGDEGLVVDCKSGKQRGSDAFQVLTCMLVLPYAHEACKDVELAGEVQYRDSSNSSSTYPSVQCLGNRQDVSQQPCLLRRDVSRVAKEDRQLRIKADFATASIRADQTQPGGGRETRHRLRKASLDQRQLLLSVPGGESNTCAQHRPTPVLGEEEDILDERGLPRHHVESRQRAVLTTPALEEVRSRSVPELPEVLHLGLRIQGADVRTAGVKPRCSKFERSQLVIGSVPAVSAAKRWRQRK